MSLKNSYISGQPVPWVEPGTGGFNDLLESTFITEYKVSTGYSAPVVEFRSDSQHGSYGKQKT
jgi:hypothetical protein